MRILPDELSVGLPSEDWVDHSACLTNEHPDPGHPCDSHKFPYYVSGFLMKIRDLVALRDIAVIL